MWWWGGGCMYRKKTSCCQYVGGGPGEGVGVRKYVTKQNESLLLILVCLIFTEDIVCFIGISSVNTMLFGMDKES